MTRQIRLGDIAVDVTFKDIKNVHLSVHPPMGRVTVAAPLRMNLETIRVYTIRKLWWIKNQQRRLRQQPREPQREMLPHESHFLWGSRYLLSVADDTRNPSVSISHNRLLLRIPPKATAERKRALLPSVSMISETDYTG